MATKATTLWSLPIVRAWLGVTAPTASAVTSITSSGTTATVTQTAHGYATGDEILIAGATPTAYNGTYTITVTGANSYTYTFGGAADVDASGTITATGPETSDDTVITRIADGVSEFLERATERVFVTRTITELHDGGDGNYRYGADYGAYSGNVSLSGYGRGGKILFLYHFPVVTFTSLTVLRSPTDSAAETVAAADYTVRLDQGKVWVHSDRLNAGINNVTAVYTAGYGAQDAATLPQDIVRAGLDLVKLIYTEKTTGAIAASVASIGSATFTLKSSYPQHIADTIRDWRRPAA